MFIFILYDLRNSDQEPVVVFNNDDLFGKMMVFDHDLNKFFNHSYFGFRVETLKDHKVRVTYDGNFDSIFGQQSFCGNGPKCGCNLLHFTSNMKITYTSNQLDRNSTMITLKDTDYIVVQKTKIVF